jgi:hypothetical protein
MNQFTEALLSSQKYIRQEAAEFFDNSP